MTAVPTSEEETPPSGFYIHEEDEESPPASPQRVIESHPHEESNDYNMRVQWQRKDIFIR